MLYLFAQAAQSVSEAAGNAAPKVADAVNKAGEAANDLANKGADAAGKVAEAAPQAAEAASQAAEASSSWISDMLHSGAMGYMLDGGLFMWPILILGIVAAGVMIERYRSLKMLATDVDDLRRRVLDLLYADRVEEALELCDNQQGPVPAILSAGLRKLLMLERLNTDGARMQDQVIKAMDDYGIHVVAALERHLPILATVSTVAPMVGFLGTVQGMIVSFGNIVAKMNEMNIVEAAAGGIMVALLTTVFGLIVGIPAFIGFNYFTSVINRFVLDVEESATELIESVGLQMALREKSLGGDHGLSGTPA